MELTRNFWMEFKSSSDASRAVLSEVLLLEVLLSAIVTLSII